MIVVKVELWPGGNGRRAKAIGAMQIANVSGLADVSDYSVRAFEDASQVTGEYARHATFQVCGHSRKQFVFALVAAAARRFVELMEAERKASCVTRGTEGE